MKRNNLLIFCLISVLSFAGCSNGDSQSSESKSESISTSESSAVSGSSDIEDSSFIQKYKARRKTSILADTNFKNGLRLISPESTNQYTEKDLNYNGEAETDFYSNETDRTNYWDMCQWWTPYNFKDAKYKKDGSSHTYENESRYLAVNPSAGLLTMKLNSYLEYQERFGRKRNGNESWSHFLIQQVSPEEMFVYGSHINDNNHLRMALDFQIDEATYLGDKNTQTTSDCAQLLYYILLRNLPPDGSDPNEVGVKNTSMWFGIPLYDSRYTNIPEYKGGDAGFEGATGHMIYTIGSKSYLPGGVEFGQKYHIDIDVTEYVQQAFVWGVANNYLPNCNWNNMAVVYSNLGWELPGEYKVSSTISNMDVYTEAIV